MTHPYVAFVYDRFQALLARESMRSHVHHLTFFCFHIPPSQALKTSGSLRFQMGNNAYASSSSSSNSNLTILILGKTKTCGGPMDTSSSSSSTQSLTFYDFLDRMRNPASLDLVRSIKRGHFHQLSSS
ncbi:hypothetical protein CsSME_00024855 [Camellia sinensis var. sinensis]